MSFSLARSPLDRQFGKHFKCYVRDWKLKILRGIYLKIAKDLNIPQSSKVLIGRAMTYDEYIEWIGSRRRNDDGTIRGLYVAGNTIVHAPEKDYYTVITGGFDVHDSEFSFNDYSIDKNDA